MRQDDQPIEEILALELEISERHLSDIEIRRTVEAANTLLVEALAEFSTLIRHVRTARFELRRRSQALRASTARLEAANLRYQELLQSSPTPYLLTDPAGRVLEVNDAGSKLLQRTTDGIVGRSLFAFVPPEDQERLGAALTAALDDGNDRCRCDVHVGTTPQLAQPATAICMVVRRGSGHVDHLRWAFCDATPRRSEPTPRTDAAERTPRPNAHPAAPRLRASAAGTSTENPPSSTPLSA